MAFIFLQISGRLLCIFCIFGVDRSYFFMKRLCLCGHVPCRKNASAARQLKDLNRNLSRKGTEDAQILMRNYMMERFQECIPDGTPILVIRAHNKKKFFL